MKNNNNQKRIISKEKEAEIWERARSFWFYAMLPQPLIIEDLDDESITPEAKQIMADPKSSPEFITFFDNQTYINMQKVFEDLLVKDESELEKAVEFLMKHGIGHYGLVPHDLLTYLMLTYHSAKTLEDQNIAQGQQAQEIGSNICNIFNDIIDNDYIVKKGEEKGHPQNEESTFFAYDKLNEKKRSDPKDKPSKTWNVYMRIYEKLWDQDGRWVENKKFSKDQENAAERIWRLMKDDMYNSRLWEKRIKRFTHILAPFIKEDGKGGQDCQMFDSGSSGQAKKLKEMIDKLKKMKEKGGKEGKDAKDLEKKIKDAEKDIENQIKGLARKMSENGKNRKLVSDYKDLLAGTGITNDVKKANKWLYRSLANRYNVKFRPLQVTEGRAHPFTPIQWNPSDPPQNLDITYTLSTQGVVIPGVTTKKWKYKKTIGYKQGDQPPDLYIIIDSSGSMTDPTQNVAPAPLAAVAAAQSARNMGKRVAVKNFSGDTDTLEETVDEDEIDDMILTYKNGGTVLPSNDLKSWVKRPDIPKQFLLITDSGFHNFDTALPYLREVLEINPKNRGAIFCIGRGNQDYIERLEKIGWEVFYVESEKDLFNLVVGKSKEIYQGSQGEGDFF